MTRTRPNERVDTRHLEPPARLAPTEPNPTCAWCDLPILGSHIETKLYTWHLECHQEAQKP